VIGWNYYGELKVKNRSILYFLAIGALTAAPAFADRIPDASKERESKSVSMESRLNEHLLRGAANGHNPGLGGFRDSNPASHMRDFDEDGKLAIMNGQLNAGSSDRLDELNFLPRMPARKGPLGKPDTRDTRRPHPIDVDDEGSSLSPVVVAEPEAFMLVLVGFSVLGLLLYRRNLA